MLHSWSSALSWSAQRSKFYKMAIDSKEVSKVDRLERLLFSYFVIVESLEAFLKDQPILLTQMLGPNISSC